MRQLFYIVCFIAFGLTLNGQNEKDVQLRFDGIYVTNGTADSLIYLLRFYEDRTVLSGVMFPMKKNWTVDSLNFKREHFENPDRYHPIGTFKIRDKEIHFTIKTKMTKKIKYNGIVVSNNELEMTIFSKKKRIRKVYTYYFMPFKK